MKKKLTLGFRIFYITLFAAILFAAIWFLLPRIHGEVTATINGTSYVPDSISCKYEVAEDELKVVSFKTDEGLKFFNHGFAKDCFEYTFYISDEELDTEVTIFYIKGRNRSFRNLDIEVDIYEEGDVWCADVTVDKSGQLYQECFYDIEKSGIEMRVSDI